MAYTPALVIQKDTYILKNGDASFGQIMLVPTPASGGMVDSDYWATPILGEGIVGNGFEYTPTTPGSLTKPDVQSFHVIRLIMQTNQSNISTTWWVVGNSTQYINTSADAEVGHASPPILMPQTLASFVPTQVLCNQNDAGLYFGILAAPVPLSGRRYFAKGYYNGVALTALSGAGYVSAATLLTALNANWSNVGTWTKSADDQTFFVTQASGSGSDVLDAAITII